MRKRVFGYFCINFLDFFIKIIESRLKFLDVIFNLGHAIKQKRNELGITGTQFAAIINVDAAALNRVEKGKALISKAALPRLAELFQMPVEDLNDEWFSEKVAMEIFKKGYSENAHLSIAEKVKFIKQKNLTQGELDL